MPRVSKLPIDQWDPEMRQMADADGTASELQLGLARIFAHAPGIAKGLMGFAGSLKIHRALPERLAELVRLRIAYHNQCRSCMAIRYGDAVNDGVNEALVCSLEKPLEAPDLTEAEKVAIAFADKMATDHLSIGDATYDELRRHFSEGEIVELGLWVALCIGVGRFAATLNMIEELPKEFQDAGGKPITPWAGNPVILSWNDASGEEKAA